MATRQLLGFRESGKPVQQMGSHAWMFPSFQLVIGSSCCHAKDQPKQWIVGSNPDHHAGKVALIADS